LPVVQIDETVIANGHPGTVSRALRERYVERSAEQAAAP
jgi:hypothetical protein